MVGNFDPASFVPLAHDKSWVYQDWGYTGMHARTHARTISAHVHTTSAGSTRIRCCATKAAGSRTRRRARSHLPSARRWAGRTLPGDSI
eukprot:UN2957